MRTFVTLAAVAVSAALVLCAPLAWADDDDDWDDRDRGRRGEVTIEIFSQPGFRGDRIVIRTDEHDLRRLGFNDRARSLRVRGGAWVVCEHIGYGGVCRPVSGDIGDLWRIGFADRISSIRFERRIDDRYDDDRNRDRDRDRDRLALFSREGFDGARLRLDGPEGNLANRGFNDAARSLRARGRWLVCSDAGFGGRCREVSGEVYDLRQLGLWGAISSARPLDGHGYGDDDGDYGYGYGRPRHNADRWFDRPHLHGRPFTPRDAVRFCQTQGFATAQNLSIERSYYGPIVTRVRCVA